MKKLLTILLVSVVIATSIVYKTASVEAAWLSGYDHRKAITVTGQTGAGTNYPVLIKIGASAGGDFHLGGNASNFPYDITFTDNDETTELSYWIESTSTDPIRVWVKVTDDLGSNATIYAYYGKAADTTDGSNGGTTFLFFDDFNDASINASKWTKDIELGSITETGGYLRNGGGITSGNYGHTSLGSEVGYASMGATSSIMWRSRASSNGIGEVVFRGDYGTNAGYKARFDARSGQGFSFLNNPYSGWGFISGCANAGTPPTADTWYRYEMQLEGSQADLYQNDSLVRSCSGLTVHTAGEVALQNHYGSYMDTDWIAIRKFQGTEPAFASASAEENEPASEVEGPQMYINNGRWIVNNGKIVID